MRIRPGSSRDQAIKSRLKAVFLPLNRFLLEQEATAWLAFGTLLGYYRERDMISGDRDVDFGLPEAEFPRIWAARRRLPKDLVMEDHSPRHGGPKLRVYPRYSAPVVQADLYFFREQGANLVCILDSVEADLQPFRSKLVFPLRTATFLGTGTRIPRRPREYLLHFYRYLGPDGVQDPRTGYWHPPARQGKHPPIAENLPE